MRKKRKTKCINLFGQHCHIDSLVTFLFIWRSHLFSESLYYDFILKKISCQHFDLDTACLYEGIFYKTGSTWETDNGCVECTCMEGVTVCHDVQCTVGKYAMSWQ